MLYTALNSLSLAASAFAAETEQDQNLNQMVNDASATGFLVAGLIALISIFLIIDMVRRIRRTRYREQVRQELQAEIEQMDSEGGHEPKTD